MSLEQRFQELDRNGDDRLTADEVGRGDWLKQADANRDGAVTLDEGRAFIGRRAARRQTAQQAPQSPPMPDMQKHLDIPYANADGVDPNLLSLDIYAPPGAEGAPVMVFVHGGGWRAGDKAGPAMMQYHVPHFVAAGYVYVSVNYRLTPAVRHPVHVQDVAAAVAWLHNHIGEYGGNASCIFLMGHSAGSHLVSLVATDDRYLKAHGKDLRIVRGVVALDNPGFDIPRLLPQVNAGLRATYEAAFSQNPEAQRDASPIAHVAEGKHIPAFFIVPSGQRRGDVLKVFEDMAEALLKVGSPAKVFVAVGKDHGGVNRAVGVPGDELSAAVMDLLAGRLAEKAADQTESSAGHPNEEPEP